MISLYLVPNAYNKRINIMTLTFPRFLILATILGLTACGNNTSNEPTSPEQTAAASTPADTAQTLISSGGKISITVPSGNFVEVGNDQAQQPDGLKADEIKLLQKDEQSGITIYVADLGKAKSSAEEYFRNLSTALETDESLNNVQTGAATSNRMNYRFNTTSGDTVLRENCIAIYDAGHLYNVCANSESADQEALSAVLKNVTINK